VRVLSLFFAVCLLDLMCGLSLLMVTFTTYVWLLYCTLLKWYRMNVLEICQPFIFLSEYVFPTHIPIYHVSTEVRVVITTNRLAAYLRNLKNHVLKI